VLITLLQRTHFVEAEAGFGAYERHGTPLYVYDEATIRNRARAYREEEDRRTASRT